MGSTMKQSIFDEQTSKALKNWRNKVKHKNNTRQGSIKVRKLGGGSSSSADAAAPGQSVSNDIGGADDDDDDHHSVSPEHTTTANAAAFASIQIHDDSNADTDAADANNIDLLSGP